MITTYSPSRRTTSLRRALVALAALPLVAAAQSPSADAILARYARTIDPQGKVASLPGLRSVGSMEVPAAGLSIALVLQQGAPDKMVMTMTVPGIGEMKQGFDGKTAWAMDPMQGPRLMSPAEQAQVADESTLLAAIRHPSLRQQAEVVGDAEVNGEPCTDVRITYKSGRQVTECYSKASGLLLRAVGKQSSPQGEVEATTVYSEYRDFDGLKIATRAEVLAMGMKQILTFTSAEVGAPAPDTFELPPAIKALAKP